MKHELLQTSLSLEEAESIQEEYSQKLKNQKQVFVQENGIKWVVGVDVSYYDEKNEEWGVACAVLWNLHANIMEHHSFVKAAIKFPYKPGFLGFRECNIIAKAIELLPEIPDIIICDGHGINHPKRFGEAVHLGLALNLPTFGVAKNPFFGYSDWKNIKRRKGNKEPIWAFKPNESKDIPQELLGYAVCLNNDMKPAFISVGYNITLDAAVDLALSTTKDHKLPEPLFLADHLSRGEL